MNLVVDYGNTAAKVGIFEQQALQQRHTFTAPAQVQEFLEHTRADNIIISSVQIETSEITSWIKNGKSVFVLRPGLPLPVQNRYATPETLGADRVAVVCGAVQLFPGENTLIIDAGTCITYDFVDMDKNYFGGAIAPGLSMRFKAVHAFTSRLPLVQPVDDAPLTGHTTETSIQSGVINGMVAEMDGIISRYRDKYKDLRVILCGGDTRFFENKMKASIFASPDLVLIGLNSILIHNVNS